jgi:PAS domain S-box-containing protein
MHELWPRAWEQLMQGHAVSYEIEDSLLNRRLLIQLRPVATPDATSRGETSAVAVINDVTEVKRAEVLLRSGFAVLEQEVSARTRDLVEANARLRREIEERRFAEHALRKSEESYRRLVDTMLEGLIAYDPEGRIVYVNDSLCRILGYGREELLGESANRVLNGVRQCSVDEVRTQPMTCPCGHYEATWMRKDGERITVLLSPQRLDGPGGDFLGCFAVVMDISDRKGAEEALRRSEAELRLLSAQLLTAQEVERKRIASELHDSIGQTLSALKFQLESAATQALGNNGQAIPELIGRLVPRIQSAVDEVRRISMDLRPSMLDDLGILPTIAWFCREFQGVYGHLKLETALSAREDEVPAPLKTVIYRIVQEAFNNIVRHARASGVQLSLERRGATLQLAVRDDGAGFTHTGAAGRDGASLGLGLSTMRERAETSGGRFRLVTAEGRGTLVHVTWPCHAPA